MLIRSTSDSNSGGSLSQGYQAGRETELIQIEKEGVKLFPCVDNMSL